MIIKKGTILKTKNATWYVTKNQKINNNDFIEVQSKDGFKTILIPSNIKVLIYPDGKFIKYS